MNRGSVLWQVFWQRVWSHGLSILALSAFIGFLVWVLAVVYCSAVREQKAVRSMKVTYGIGMAGLAYLKEQGYAPSNLQQLIDAGYVVITAEGILQVPDFSTYTGTVEDIQAIRLRFPSQSSVNSEKLSPIIELRGSNDHHAIRKESDKRLIEYWSSIISGELVGIDFLDHRSSHPIWLQANDGT